MIANTQSNCIAALMTHHAGIGVKNASTARGSCAYKQHVCEEPDLLLERGARRDKRGGTWSARRIQDAKPTCRSFSAPWGSIFGRRVPSRLLHNFVLYDFVLYDFVLASR